MTVLADTSIWIEYLRRGTRGEAARLDALMSTNELLVCGPVVAELMAGTSDTNRADVWRSLAGLPWADLGREEWYLVGVVSARLREQGRPAALTDIEIAVSAKQAEASLWTSDSNFDRIGEALGGIRRFSP